MNKVIKQIWVIGFVFLAMIKSNLPAQSINLGIPPVRHFSKQQYKAGTQNWEIAQDARGLIWCANNEGVLRFDGVYWSLFPVANHTIVRSLLIHPDGRIFAGAQGELGYFFPDAKGRLEYHSLTALLPEGQRNFADVWDIVLSGQTVLFRTDQEVFAYDGHAMKVLVSGMPLTAMFATPQGLFLQKEVSELWRYDNGQFSSLLQLPDLKSTVTSAIALPGDTVLLTTLKNGIFSMQKGQVTPWVTPHDALLREKRIYAAARLDNGDLAIGTSLYGLLSLDAKGRMVRHLDKTNGLKNANILHVFADRSGKVWLGLDNGIDCVDLGARFTAIIPDGNLEGTGYSAGVSGGRFYLGVSNGLYETPWQSFYNPEQSPYFKKVANTDGQVWGLNEVGGQLLLGHHEGVFKVNGDNANRIPEVQGAWTFVSLNAEYMLVGTYSGLVLYQKTAAGWAYAHQFAELKESCRVMVKDERGYIWVSHPYRGLYRIEWSPGNSNKIQVKFYNSAQGLPADLNNYVFGISGKAVVGTIKGVYQYEPAKDAFVPDTLFNEVLGPDRWIKYLCQDKRGNIWYKADHEVGMLVVDDFGLKKKVDKQIFPELSEKMVAGFEFIYPYDAENVFIGTEQGFIHYNPAADRHAETLPQIILSSVSMSSGNDSVIFGGSFLENGVLVNEQPSGMVPKLSAVQNNLRFAFSAVDFSEPNFITYRTQLKGMDKVWSEWSAIPERIVTNLNPGKYTLMVQARRAGGTEGPVLFYRFVIRPPWYASAWAFGIYWMALLGILTGLWHRQKQRFEREKAVLTERHLQKEEEHLRTVEATQATLMEVENEKLEAEIQFKNQELASATMHLVQKGEMLVSISETLNQILEKSTNPEVKREIQQLLNLLNFDQKLDEDWQQFAFHFDQVHVDFLKRLREKHPQLSPNDHKLCAYLRMNLTTKEIAPLMNISVRGVEASRYRLRKRANLPNDAHLNDFIMGI
jgi:ligand-binding sensor domain-containing protein/DNA-binding CsgD family transcriptional regulator